MKPRGVAAVLAATSSAKGVVAKDATASQVPISRQERLKRRLVAQAEDATAKRPRATAKPEKATSAKVASQEQAGSGGEAELTSTGALPVVQAVKAKIENGKNEDLTPQISASSFLAAARDRLLRHRKAAGWSAWLETLAGDIDSDISGTASVAPRPPPFPPRLAPPATLGAASEPELEVMSEGPGPSKLPPMPQPLAQDESDEEVGDEASVLAAVRKGREGCVAQLARTIFRRERAAGEGGRQRLAVIRYAARAAGRLRFPRELYILRGPPGIGKSEYAAQLLSSQVDYSSEDALAARLAHICAADDFFEEYVTGQLVYHFDPRRLEPCHARNEVRARLAMEAGIHPVIIDCTNLRLWEMRAYLVAAERLGYVPTVVDPGSICVKWDDLDFLVAANDTQERRLLGKVVAPESLKAMIEVFEPLPLAEDRLSAIRNSCREGGSRVKEEALLISVDDVL